MHSMQARRPLLAPARNALYESAMSPSKSPPSSPSFLSHAELDTVIRLAPLVAIDLIIHNDRDEVLLGLRRNEPAKDCYFVPGGMILKNERLAQAFARLVEHETGHAGGLDDARLIGVFEHFYDSNRSGRAGYGTHYVVLGYELKWSSTAAPRPDDQHSELRWWPIPKRAK